MNKRKRVAWRKHRIRARKLEIKERAEKAATGATARPASRSVSTTK